MINATTLKVKYIFLQFTQALFSEITPFRWDYNPTISKIIIADRNVADLGVAMQKPAILLQRGGLMWTYLVRGQDGTNVSNFKVDGLAPLSGNSTTVAKERKYYTDLMQGSVVFNVLSKSGLQAEMLADLLFTAITGNKDKFRLAGIFQFNSMAISEERVIKQIADVETFGVSIQIGFSLQSHIKRDVKVYNISISSDTDELHEGFDYNVINNGTNIQLLNDYYEPSGLKVDYVDAITLEQKSDVAMILSSGTNIYTLEDSGTVLGYYNMLSAITSVSSPPDSANDYENFDEVESEI